MASLAGSMGLCAALVLLAGCGGSGGKSGSTPPPGGGLVGGWGVVSQGTHTRGATVAKATGTANDPLRLRMRVDSTPRVDTQTTYEVQCGDKTAYGKSLPGHTPVVRELRMGGCVFTLLATKSKPAKMTVTLLTRSP